MARAGTEEGGGGLKYLCFRPEATRVWPRCDLIPIKLSLPGASPASRTLPRSTRAGPCLALC